MISALLYLQYHTLKNRTAMRFKRLRQPKYLLGGIVGGLYFYFYFIRYLFGVPVRRQPLVLGGSPADLALYEGLGALVLLVVVLIAWIVPRERSALAFTEAEVAFLFPAPISRRGLIHFKLLRSQMAILFTTFLLMLVANRWGGKLWIHALGWWLILSTLNLHFLGCSFARTMLLDRGISNWRRRLVVLGLVGLAAGWVTVWAWHSLPRPDLSGWEGTASPVKLIEAAKHYLRQVLISGPLPYLLYPCRVVVRPYLAPGAPAFLRALGPALLLLALHYWWVIRSDVAFEEASVEAAKKTAAKIAAVRSGNWQAASRRLKARRPPFVLRPTGWPAAALLWKNLISAGHAFTWRLWLSLAIFGVCLGIGVGQGAGHAGITGVLAALVGALFGWFFLVGPLFLRQDLRQDLPVADLLKTYPLRGWQIAAGEVLAPAVILTGIQWLLLLVAVPLICFTPLPGLDRRAVLGIGLGAAVVIPMLNLLVLQIPNAAVLLFPAWFQAGKEAPHGLEATGQRLIFMVGQMLALLLAVVPAAVAFAIVFFPLKLVLDWPLVVPLASVAAALVLAGEAALGLIFLGWRFDRLDLSSETPGLNLVRREWPPTPSAPMPCSLGDCRVVAGFSLSSLGGKGEAQAPLKSQGHPDRVARTRCPPVTPSAPTQPDNRGARVSSPLCRS